MGEKKYEVSDTTLEAEWIEQGFGHKYYQCSNCRHSIDHGYPARGIDLGKFCPECGFKMKNPRYVGVYYDYD